MDYFRLYEAEDLRVRRLNDLERKVSALVRNTAPTRAQRFFEK